MDNFFSSLFLNSFHADDENESKILSFFRIQQKWNHEMCWKNEKTIQVGKF